MTRTTRSDGEGSLLVALGMSAGPLVALGLARFAYALLLPAMRDDLGWSYSGAGTLTTSNAAGYLLGALAAAPLAARVGARRCFVAGIAVTAALLLATAASSSLVVLIVIRLVAGVSGAFSFVVGGGLVAEASHGATRSRAALMLGLYFGGAGAGIVLAGLLVPAVLSATDSWRLGWIVLGVIGAVALAVSLLAIRRLSDPAPPAPDAERWDRRAIAPVFAGYTCFGLGYIAYLTFVIALLTERGFGAGEVAAFWSVVGVAAVASGFIWGPALGRLPGGRGMATIMLVLATGTALPVWLEGAVSTYLSGVLVGGSFLAVVTAMTIAVRQALPQAHWTAGMAYATVGFGLGQTVGPVLTGWVSDHVDGLTSGFLVSAVVLVVGAGLARVQPTGQLAASQRRSP